MFISRLSSWHPVPIYLCSFSPSLLFASSVLFFSLSLSAGVFLHLLQLSTFPSLHPTSYLFCVFLVFLCWSLLSFCFNYLLLRQIWSSYRVCFTSYIYVWTSLCDWLLLCPAISACCRLRTGLVIFSISALFTIYSSLFTVKPSDSTTISFGFTLSSIHGIF